MDISKLQAWTYDSADQTREEDKRWRSPCSFFYSQGHELVLAAKYFENARLLKKARGGVAKKHRHRIQLALFGQLMASLEYMFKDFFAQTIDAVDIYDAKVKAASWIVIDSGKVLNSRALQITPGAMLLHSTQGWQEPKAVNDRYSNIFQIAPIEAKEISILEQLWILRHSVAHNAGLVTAQDAVRGGMPLLSDGVAAIDDLFIEETFIFLCPIARRIAGKIGDKVVQDWLRTKGAGGHNYPRDKGTYAVVKLLATYVESRVEDLPKPKKSEYSADFKRANP